MKSMTGFGRAASRPQTPAHHGLPGEMLPETLPETLAELDVSVRTVNGRYFDIRTHLPREYAGLESNIKALLSKRFSRGTLDIYINRGRSSASTKVHVNASLAEQYVAAYRKLGQSLGLEFEPTLELLTRLPDVLKIDESGEIDAAEKQLVLDLVDRAARDCEAERSREGHALKEDLDSLCIRLELLVDGMLSLRLEANTELERRLRERLQKLGFEGVVDDQRVAQEIVLQLDRSDISEELTRLREHIRAYRALLLSSVPEGKKLDFYAQELLREVNTIGSKSQILKLTGLVVDAKTLVEKVREQVQNIE